MTGTTPERQKQILAIRKDVYRVLGTGHIDREVEKTIMKISRKFVAQLPKGTFALPEWVTRDVIYGLLRGEPLELSLIHI